MNKLLILVLTTFTAGCIEGTHVDSGNPTLSVKRVGYIAEHGCTIYLIDHRSYALVCPNTASTDVLTQAGKTAVQAITR
jgi:trehalose-6-phosphatase